MTKLEYFHLEKANGIVKITLNRPKHNVLNIDMMNELNRELEELQPDPDLKCIIFYGEGRSFCAGVEVSDHKPEMAEEMIDVFTLIFKNLERFDIPLVAAVHGACLGGGMELAIGCDIILAAKSAFFGQPEIKLGFLPPYAAVRLPHLIGPAKAIEICVTGKRYTAEEAHALGLVHHVYEDEDFMDEVEKFISEIQGNSPLIIRLNKKAVKNHLGLPMEEAIKKVNEMFLQELMKTEDTLEGIKSFEEKRMPEWKNR